MEAKMVIKIKGLIETQGAEAKLKIPRKKDI